MFFQDENPHAALLFYWHTTNRQIRIEGRVHKVSSSVADQYFANRPVMSQISARISQQSTPVESRDILSKKQNDEFDHWKKVANGDESKIVVPKPSFWGGYSVVPNRFEFWQGQSDRLHDRIVFQLGTDKSKPNEWSMGRLQP